MLAKSHYREKRVGFNILRLVFSLYYQNEFNIQPMDDRKSATYTFAIKTCAEV